MMERLMILIDLSSACTLLYDIIGTNSAEGYAPGVLSLIGCWLM